MSLSLTFLQPILIYDDRCSLCVKFAKSANILSGGWIRTAGHYHSQEAIKVKNLVFPPGYDTTKMFWLINKKGAYGGRAGLMPLIKEVLDGRFRKKQRKKQSEGDDYDYNIVCDYNTKLACISDIKSTLKRIVNMMQNSGRFSFHGSP